MTSSVQRRSRLKLALGLLYLGLVLVVCGDDPETSCNFWCSTCPDDPNDPNNPNDPNDITACMNCETCGPLLREDQRNSEAGSVNGDAADLRVAKGASAARGVPEQVQVSGPAAFDQPATLSDGSAQASVNTQGGGVRNEGLEVVCTFQLPVGDLAVRRCIIDGEAHFFYRAAGPSIPAVLINASLEVYQIGTGSVPFDAHASVACGAGTLVLVPGNSSFIIGPNPSGGCTMTTHIEANTIAAGVNAVRTVLTVQGAPGPCTGSTECQLADPLTPCCGFEGCHDCSVGNSCVHDTQCAEGLFCSGFACSEGNLGDRCDTDFDCADSRVCSGFSCVPAAPCNPVDNEGCAPGERCCSIGRIAFGETLIADCCPEGDVPPGDPCIVDSGGQDNCTGGNLCAAGICQETCHEVLDSCPQGQQCDVGTYSIENIRGDGVGICSAVP